MALVPVCAFYCMSTYFNSVLGKFNSFLSYHTRQLDLQISHTIMCYTGIYWLIFLNHFRYDLVIWDRFSETRVSYLWDFQKGGPQATLSILPHSCPASTFQLVAWYLVFTVKSLAVSPWILTLWRVCVQKCGSGSIGLILYTIPMNQVICLFAFSL